MGKNRAKCLPGKNYPTISKAVWKFEKFANATEKNMNAAVGHFAYGLLSWITFQMNYESFCLFIGVAVNFCNCEMKLEWDVLNLPMAALLMNWKFLLLYKTNRFQFCRPSVQL